MPTLHETRTVTRFAWLPTFTDDRESFFDLTWLQPVRVTERYSDAPGEAMFFPEVRWRRVRVERA